MPAYSEAILIHCEHPDFDPAVAAVVQAETYLGVTQCNPRIEQSKEAIYIPALDDDLTIYSPGRLFWDITATVLDWQGLAHVHPGTALSRGLLTSANVLFRMPFQRAAGGTLTYESPRLGQDGGSLPVLSFTLAEVMGGELDSVNYPSGEESGIGTGEFFSIDPVDSVRLPAATLTKLLQDIFHNTGHFDTGLLCAGYDVLIPAATHTEDDLPDWPGELATEDGDETESAIPNPTFVFESVENPTAATFLRLRRSNGTHCVDIPVGSVTVPSGRIFRLDAGDLNVLLQWPWDGALDLPAAGHMRPARRALWHVLGGALSGILGSGTYFTLKAWNGDPCDGGTLNDSWAIGRDSGTWTVAAATATAGANSTGSNVAPVDGWETTFVTIEIPIPDTYFLKVELAVPVTTLEGAPITILASDLTVTIA